MAKIYVGDVGTQVLVNCGMTITGATGTTLEVKKPSGTEVSWTATINGTTNLRYIVIADDLDEAGTYQVQAKLTLAGWTGLGETASFTVHAVWT